MAELIENIPVFLQGFHPSAARIGVGTTDENGDLVIKILASDILERIEHLANIGDIKGLALGVAFQPTVVEVPPP